MGCESQNELIWIDTNENVRKFSISKELSGRISKQNKFLELRWIRDKVLNEPIFDDYLGCAKNKLGNFCSISAHVEANSIQGIIKKSKKD